ncbi:hypothetical protein [Endozoicomonas acroporae]|uniref:hypothetical protein n=1 Tax=Endozoicomonas acroporae TaxID=1701104 RepID=UPI003D78C41E
MEFTALLIIAFVAYLAWKFIFRKKGGGGEPHIIFGDGDFNVDAVGESNYQLELEEIAGGKLEESCDMPVDATLVCEDDNPYDDKAVAVVIEGEIVGYLSRKQARQHRKEMAKIGHDGQPAMVDAMIVGGWKRARSEGDFGVKLDIPHL